MAAPILPDLTFGPRAGIAPVPPRNGRRLDLCKLAPQADAR